MTDVQSRRARSHATFTVPGTIGAVVERLRTIAAEDPRFRLRAAASARVVLGRRMNWWTWGETITIDLGVAGRAETLVDVRVEPTLPTTAIDWGQGARDIERLRASLTSGDGLA